RKETAVVIGNISPFALDIPAYRAGFIHNNTGFTPCQLFFSFFFIFFEKKPKNRLFLLLYSQPDPREKFPGAKKRETIYQKRP
ncbi:MAG: hypothetical protein LBF95_07750, partial [Treponema sp.]|nr:hypothetical protein [Treponema sp.]